MFLVIVASFILVALYLYDDGVSISIHPPSSEGTPPMVAVGDIIQCDVNRSPYKSLKWYNNNWKLVSDLSALVVTEDMRFWKQPITLKCMALYGKDYETIDDSYTFLVTNTSSGADGFGEISFSPPSSMDAPTTLTVGSNIQCMANGMRDPTFEWYDHKKKLVSGSSGVNVTVKMRYLKQPITLRCTAKSGGAAVTQESEGFYTFLVANPYSGPEPWAVVLAMMSGVVLMLAIFYPFHIIEVLQNPKRNENYRIHYQNYTWSNYDVSYMSDKTREPQILYVPNAVKLWIAMGVIIAVLYFL